MFAEDLYSTYDKKTLPEAQRTQGIEFITQINFLTDINLTLYISQKRREGRFKL